jgi:FkbM family methyltransferase
MKGLRSYSRQQKRQELAALAAIAGSVLILAWFLLGAADAPRTSQSSSPRRDSEKAPTDMYPRDRRCTDQEREWQAKIFPAVRVRGCSAKDFAAVRLAHLHLSSAKYVLDIGSNKGYAAAELFELFSPELGITRKRLKTEYADPSFPEDLKGDKAFATECGGCNECRDEVAPLVATRISRACTDKAGKTTSGKKEGEILLKAVDELCGHLATSYRPLRVWSFEANPDLVRALKTSMGMLEQTLLKTVPRPSDIPVNRFPAPFKSLSSVWSVENLALTSTEHAGKPLRVTLKEGELGRVDLVPFPSSRVDDERSATFWVKPRANAETAQVQSTTVDDIIRRLERDEGITELVIDFVKIDVEGHDFAVLRGAQKALAGHAIRLLKFEYGQLWTEPLAETVQWLDSLEYACYFEGKNGFAKLTGGCWTEAMESHFWSNVWCLSLRHSESLAASLAFDGLTVAFWS